MPYLDVQKIMVQNLYVKNFDPKNNIHYKQIKKIILTK